MITELRANFDYDIRVTDIADQVGGGYTAKLVVGGAASLTVNGTIDGEDVIFPLAATATANLATGQYWYQIVSESGALRNFIADGLLWVIGKITGSGVYDGRSVARRVVDAIDAVMAGKATADQQSYVIQSQLGSRSLSRLSMEDLLKARTTYARLAAAEDRAFNDRSIFKKHTLSPSRVL